MEIFYELVSFARAKDVQITIAESCTGGLFSAKMTEIPGASDVFQQGFITYANDTKIDALGVRGETLNQFGAVSPQTALEMAEGARRVARADLALSITGIAGPGGSADKPEGRVCFALSHGTATKTWQVDFGAIGREDVRRAACQFGAEQLLAFLRDGDDPQHEK